MSAFEPVAAAGPPPEWGDPFDAFATSRLRPGAPREPLLHGDAAASEGLADQHRPEEERSPPHLSAGPPLRWPSEPGGSPGVAPEETLAGGEQPWGGTCAESWPGHSPSGACEEAAVSGASLNRQVPPRAAVEAEAPDPWGEAWEALAAGAPAPATQPDSELPLSPALESLASQPGSLEKSPPRSPTESKPERPAVLPLGTRSPASEDASAVLCCRDAARQEQAAPQMPPAPGQQPALGKGRLPEEADELGGSAEEPRGGEEGRQEGTEPAPPKPPRRFTPLSLAEEAEEALWGARPRRESQEGPGGEADGQGPPGGGGGGSSSSNAPWVIGAGGGSVGCGAEGLLLPAAGDAPARANERARRAGSWGDSQPVAGEQLETCPGKPGPAGAGGEPLSALPSGLRPLPFPRPLPVAEEAGLGPSGTPQGPEPSPPVLFWTALEEQLPQSPDGASPERPRGLREDTSDREPSLERGGRAALASPEVDRTWSQSGWAPPACPQAFFASGPLRQGPGGDSELSSSWSDDRVLDFKKADFWQAERAEESSAPGNPFVFSRASPQNNPFVGRPPPDAPPAPRASPAKGPSFRDLHAEAAPQGLLPAALSQDRPAAPSPHGNQPLAFSTPSLGDEAVSSGGFDFPSPIGPPAPSEGSAASGLLDARLSLALPSPSTDAAAPSVSPVETRPADEVPVQRTTSPHLVKPISTSRPVEKQRRSSLPLSQEKLKPKPASSDDSAPPILPLEKTDLKREEPSLPDCSAKYYHLTHDELIQLLLKREAELGKKQEHIRELENYIDRLLVRIMEQSPTLLQIPLGGGARAAK